MADKKTAEVKLHMLEPRATEKTYLEQTKRTYVFPVKKSIGKKTKFSKGKHAYPGITHRQDKKYAYVTLAEGNSIRVFDEPEKEEKKTSAKEAKKADKNAGKENK